MTREEALEFIGQSVKSDVDMAKIADAIKALSAEPCEDAISRQAVLDYIDEMSSALTFDGRMVIRRRTLEKYISDTLPPVTPKQKVGRWIKVDDEEPIAYDCSECGAMVSRRYRFCPNCGAKMAESDDI